jgi:hypothetical protein
MTTWTKEEKLSLIELIRRSNVWDIKFNEYKDANVLKHIFR